MTATVLPGFLDAHVHLALIDPALLAAGGIARVIDLGGWAPDAAPGAAPGVTAGAPFPDVVFAGQFLTAPGGYPSGRSWAPADSVCEVAGPAAATAAVDRQLARGASVIKVTLNAEAGPVLAADALTAVVARAHERGTAVVAHAQGVGQVMRAFVCGVDALAHAPFSERLVDELVEAMAGRMTWISTLDIHGWGEHNDDFSRASDNLRRFHAHGGRVLYGTDLGNGPLPVGLNRREIEALLGAGLSPDEVIGALTGTTRLAPARPARPPRPHGPAAGGLAPVTLVPGERPPDNDAFAAWLCGARVLARGAALAEAGG